MTLARTTLQAVTVLLAAAALGAQEPGQEPVQPSRMPAPVHHAKPKSEAAAFNPNLIVLDPGHGGSDAGAKLAGDLVEKNITLSLANTLRSLLVSRGFTVMMTRENSTDEIPLDARVELANRTRPLACILLHASPAGHGVHLFTSALTPPAASQGDPGSGQIVPWDIAQAIVVPQSLRLASDLVASLNSLRVPLVSSRASVSPIDSLTCPAATIEIAPIGGSAGSESAVSEPSYQQHVAEALASALVFWRGHAQMAAQAAAAASQAAAQAAFPGEPTAAPKPRPKPRPRPIVLPDGSPAVTPEASPAAKPAPVIRRPPPSEPPGPPQGATR